MKKRSFLLRALVIFIIVALIAVIVMMTYATNKNLREKERLEKIKENEQMRVDELENTFNSEIDDEYIEDRAREKGYSKQDEVVFYNNIPES